MMSNGVRERYSMRVAATGIDVLVGAIAIGVFAIGVCLSAEIVLWSVRKR
jgi:hypothetical protein